MARRKKTLEEFKRDANKAHNNKYGYDNVIIYLGNKIKVWITCYIHEDFEQTPNHHINRCQGCPDCAIKRRILAL